MHALGHYTTNDGGQSSSSILKEKLDLWKMSLTFIFFSLKLIGLKIYLLCLVFGKKSWIYQKVGSSWHLCYVPLFCVGFCQYFALSFVQKQLEYINNLLCLLCTDNKSYDKKRSINVIFWHYLHSLVSQLESKERNGFTNGFFLDGWVIRNSFSLCIFTSGDRRERHSPVKLHFLTLMQKQQKDEERLKIHLKERLICRRGRNLRMQEDALEASRGAAAEKKEKNHPKENGFSVTFQ